MRKLLLTAFFLALLPFLSFGKLRAVDKTSQEHYQDFLSRYRQYQATLEPFKTKKSQHLAYQSVETQAELLEASQKLLQAETQALVSYALFVKTYLAEATQILNYQESYLYVKLDDEIAFFKLSEQKAGSLSSLAEVSLLARELKTHYEKFSSLSYQVKSMVEIASTRKIIDNLKVEKEKIGQYLSQKETQTSQFLAAQEKFSQLDEKIKTGEEKLAEAEELKNSLGKKDDQKVAKDIRKKVNEAIEEIKQIISGYRNIIFSLKD